MKDKAYFSTEVENTQIYRIIHKSNCSILLMLQLRENARVFRF
jgi:hypothetical protein